MPTQRGDFEKFEVERKGSKVILTLTCADEYAAMMVYDGMAEKAEDGKFSLSFTLRTPSPS